MALLSVFGKVMRSFPFVSGGHLRRTIDGTQAIGELALLGLEPQLLLAAYAEEYSLGMDVAASLDLGPGREAERAVYWEGWVQLRGAFKSVGNPGDLDPDFRRAVSAWVRTADPEAVIDRRPPDSLPTSSPRDTRAQEAEYRWLITRLSETYLDSWSLEALETEYKYVTCVWEPAHVPTTLVRLRNESRAAVSEALAQKLMSTDRDPKSDRTREAFTTQAINLVQSGDNKGAATLLEVACELHPDDWMLANNLGFCLIPLDPGRAITSFERARKGVPDGRTIPLVELNDALAHLRTGRPAEAAAIVGAIDGDTMPRDKALLWIADEGLLSSTLEAKWIPLQDYWTMLSDIIQPQGFSAGPSEEVEDEAGR